MHFKKGDKVVYVKKCHDHEGNTKGLTIGQLYTVKLVGNDHVLLEEPYWYVDKDCVELFEGDVSKYSQVCFKVKQLENKFNSRKNKETEYAF